MRFHHRRSRTAAAALTSALALTMLGGPALADTTEPSVSSGAAAEQEDIEPTSASRWRNPIAMNGTTMRSSSSARGTINLRAATSSADGRRYLWAQTSPYNNNWHHVRLEVRNPGGGFHRSTRQHIDRNYSQAYPALDGYEYRACVITTGTSGCPGGAHTTSWFRVYNDDDVLPP